MGESALPKRRENRLAGYDYSQPGCYFVTFCVTNHLPLLRRQTPPLCRGAHCAPAPGLPPLTNVFQITQRTILDISSHYKTITVEQYVVMPNHVHLLLRIHHAEGNGRTLCAPTDAPSVPRVIKMLKETVTKAIGHSIWQKGCHDHGIRNEADCLRIWDYIRTNPAKWREDRCYAENEG